MRTMTIITNKKNYYHDYYIFLNYFLNNDYECAQNEIYQVNDRKSEASIGIN